MFQNSKPCVQSSQLCLREVKEFFAETTGPKATYAVCTVCIHYTCIEQTLKVKLVILYNRHGVKCAIELGQKSGD